MSAPARLRDHYVVGRAGSYLCPTIAACDRALKHLRLQLGNTLPVVHPALLADIDSVLDRRLELVFAAHVKQAMAATR